MTVKTTADNLTDNWDKIIWKTWKRKFAFYPTRIGKDKIWLKYYYKRIGNSMFVHLTQKGTLFDILTSDKITYENIKNITDGKTGQLEIK